MSALTRSSIRDLGRVAGLVCAAGFAVVFTLSSVGDSSASSGVIFETNWDTAVGTSTSAVTDGGRWPNYWEFNHGSSVQLMSVQPGGPSEHNALRVQQRGSTYAADLQITHITPQSTDYYMRYYMKNDDTSSAGDHIVAVDTWNFPNLEFMRKTSSASDWSFVTGVYGCGYTWPIGYWGPAGRLAHAQWYRFENFVHYTDATHIQVHPRVYDSSGALLYSDAEFQQTAYGSGSWNGRNNWTLAAYYAARYTFCVDPTVNGWPAQPEVGVATCQTPILDSCSHSGQTRQSTTV